VVDTELAKEEQATERYFLALETGSLAVTTRLQRLETFATTSAALQALVARIEVESRSAVRPSFRIPLDGTHPTAPNPSTIGKVRPPSGSARSSRLAMTWPDTA
jgi:hypothetical protein